MKKSVLFLIAVVCIVSIFVVALFGAKATYDQFKVYIDQIEITSYTREIEGEKYLFVDYNDLEPASVFIIYKVGPQNATNPSSVKFLLSGDKYLDEDGKEVIMAEIDAKGELCLYKKCAVRVKVISTDGLKVSDSITVVCR